MPDQPHANQQNQCSMTDHETNHSNTVALEARNRRLTAEIALLRTQLTAAHSRVIETIEDMDALAPGALVQVIPAALDPDPLTIVWVREPDGQWVEPGSTERYDTDQTEITLPAWVWWPGTPPANPATRDDVAYALAAALIEMSKTQRGATPYSDDQVLLSHPEGVNALAELLDQQFSMTPRASAAFGVTPKELADALDAANERENNR